MTPQVYDDRACRLGEGLLWHPLRKQLFWFDILGRKLLTRTVNGPQSWSFDTYASATGWLDENLLLVATADGLWQFDLRDGSRTLIAPLEQHNAATRSNDGRADPWGGFWIGTMGLAAEPAAGAIYRLYQGTLRKLFGQITISNAICFAPDRSFAYFTDTVTRQIMRVPLDRTGWPAGKAEVFIDMKAEGLNPDGAVIDAAGHIWVAQWGAGRVACYDAKGHFRQAIPLPAQHISCPAFGGPDYDTLFATSALQGIPDALLRDAPRQGMTFSVEAVGPGLPEPQVLL